MDNRYLTCVHTCCIHVYMVRFASKCHMITCSRMSCKWNHSLHNVSRMVMFTKYYPTDTALHSFPCQWPILRYVWVVLCTGSSGLLIIYQLRAIQVILSFEQVWVALIQSVVALWEHVFVCVIKMKSKTPKSVCVTLETSIQSNCCSRACIVSHSHRDKWDFQWDYVFNSTWQHQVVLSLV